jgi:biopolymer transport protein ExbB
MKRPSRRLVLLILPLVLAAAARAETFDEAVKRAAADYQTRLQQAADQLNQARAKISGEKAPLLNEMRSAEDRIVAAQARIERLQAAEDQAAEDRRKLLTELESKRKSGAYLTTLAHDALTAFDDGLAPGESERLSSSIQEISQRLDDTSGGTTASSAVDAAELMLEQTRQELGGYTMKGQSLVEGDNRVFTGTFAFVGPETFFLPDQGAGAGTVRPRAGSPFPVAYPLREWASSDAQAFFQGQPSRVLADASGGKALRLSETRGRVLDQIQKGGYVAYAIIAVGAVAALMVLQKILDLKNLSLGDPAAIREVLRLVASGDAAAAAALAKNLKEAPRELFQAGLACLDSPRELLEEQLQTVLLKQRLHFERRLPLLAVIATAAPLMGLLGTVVGMVKTFALITVFGTGNAAKLASGISEVLVATELGLIVAIPTLIAHGFLAQTIQRNLGMLERHAVEFVAAVESSRPAQDPVTA